MTDTLLEIICQPTDKVRCLKCHHVRYVGDLVASEGHKFPKSEKAGAFWQSMYYHCPCDLVHPLVYDAGDGVLQFVWLCKAELLK